MGRDPRRQQEKGIVDMIKSEAKEPEWMTTIRKRINETFKDKKGRLFDELLDAWLNWMKNGGNASSCESVSNLGRRMYGILEDIKDRSEPGYSAKDLYG